MKTYQVALFFVAFFSFSLLAQAQVRVSPKVGVHVAALDAAPDDFTAQARTGWHAGVDFRMGKGLFYLNPGLQYNSLTARLVENIDQDTRLNFEEETTIQSLKAPLNVGLRITGDNGLLGLYLKGGVVPTYVMGVKETDNFDFSVDRLNRLTWGANAGLGIDLLFLTADLTYEKGLTDFFNDAAGKNNVLSLSVGVKF
ncbi:MAG: outer membrane beta-barrel protein [Saprospiraceae bacterium]